VAGGRCVCDEVRAKDEKPEPEKERRGAEVGGDLKVYGLEEELLDEEASLFLFWGQTHSPLVVW